MNGSIAVVALTLALVSMLIYAWKRCNDIRQAEIDAMDEAEHTPFTEDDAVREIPPAPRVAEVAFEG